MIFIAKLSLWHPALGFNIFFSDIKASFSTRYTLYCKLMNGIKFCGLLIFCLIYFSCNTGPGSGKKLQPTDTIASKDIRDTLSKKNHDFIYNVKSPNHSWRLPSPLVEVSGNTWMDSNHLILIEDLHPNLYFIRLDDKTATLEKTVAFDSAGKEKIDIEDVTLVDNTIYALWSHGVLFKISDWPNKIKVERLNTGLDKKNNTEGLCYDPITKQLLIACKDDAGVQDEKKSVKAVYQFDIKQNKLATAPFMLIHKKDFEEITGTKLSFNPSAIAVHPITGDIYILTTRENKGLAIFSHDGVLKSYNEIDKLIMPQPEGICFSPGGKLFISSEGKQGEPGNLFEFDSQSK